MGHWVRGRCVVCGESVEAEDQPRWGWNYAGRSWTAHDACGPIGARHVRAAVAEIDRAGDPSTFLHLPMIGPNGGK